jgi:aspartyl-tRNA(Asn)/glutamyl-tRNA(Gln) amidotransferase subunit B
MESSKYETVIGLEVHAQLSTQTKLFSGDSIYFGANPNTQVSPITLGHPGTLPKTNAKVIDLAVKLGLACNCEIVQKNYFARKNYFYPDLPKGYQISQHTTPICKGGNVLIVVNGQEKNVLLNRIHIEEDAGKSIHDIYEDKTCIDLNRAGTPLLEIVTEPCLHSSDEAFEYVTVLRKLVRWLDVCDGNMEEGSLRCDANISIRLKGETTLGTKVEIKNLNSIRSIKKAIDAEVKRMTIMLENGEIITQQTRTYDVNSDTTLPIRDKEDANDYRYFADPDLTPFNLSKEYIEKIKKELPALPNELIYQFKKDFSLTNYDAQQLCEEKSVAIFFIEASSKTSNYKALTNFILGPIKQYLNDNNVSINDIHLNTNYLAELIEMIDESKVNFSVASTKILPIIIQENKSPFEIATSANLLQVSESNELEAWVDEVLAKMPEKVTEYKKGKKGLIGLFVGEVKKMSKGKADPKMVNSILEQKLSN